MCREIPRSTIGRSAGYHGGVGLFHLEPSSERHKLQNLRGNLPICCTMASDLDRLDKQFEAAYPADNCLELQPAAAPAFTARERTRILAVALIFAFMTAMQISAYSISLGSLAEELKATPFQATLGISTYGWASVSDRIQSYY